MFSLIHSIQFSLVQIGKCFYTAVESGMGGVGVGGEVGKRSDLEWFVSANFSLPPVPKIPKSFLLPQLPR